ncbi:polyadenylate-binding protein 8-like [Cannabis sativa]|uniref:polyadenylate-binding protein 8-like n=1 Tax=Cannabis sativa TaxID=3483 RepID=UPI0029CA10BB|nr:polyadenylate-binding protein 8-like [Cannabis sativa]
MAQVDQVEVPTQNGVTMTSLYVGDLDASINEADLFEIFSQMGYVVSVRVCRDLISHLSLGYGYVNFSNPQEASRALNLMNFSTVNGKPIRIMYSYRDPSIRKSGIANIFVKNLDKGIDSKALHETFSIFGNILSCKIATDDVSGQSKGYGFVQFDSKEAAQSAIEKLNGMLLNDKQVFVGPFIRKEKRKLGAEQNVDKNKGMNLYVKNLDDSVTDEKLKELFFVFGTITSCKVMRKPNGVSMGFGFVALSTVEEASRALVEMNGKMVVSKPLYVALAQRKEDRRARLQAQFSQMRPPTMVPPVNPCMPMIPPQLGFGYQQQLLPGVRPNFYMPIVQPHPSFVQPQMLPRGRGFHRFPPGRNMPGRSFH